MKAIKEELEVKTTTAQLDSDTAKDDGESKAGTTAFKTFMTKDIELSNEKHIPFHAVEFVEVTKKVSDTDTKDNICNDDTEPTPPTPEPGEVSITGTDDITINQGIGIDLKDGVKATLDGEEIPFTVSPETIEKCEVGEHEVAYTADDVSVIRKVTITAISDPTINGIDEPITVEVGEEFDPLEGVSAKDGNGNDIDVSIGTLIWKGQLETSNEGTNYKFSDEQKEMLKVGKTIVVTAEGGEPYYWEQVKNVELTIGNKWVNSYPQAYISEQNSYYQLYIFPSSNRKNNYNNYVCPAVNFIIYTDGRTDPDRIIARRAFGTGVVNPPDDYGDVIFSVYAI